MKRNWDDVRDVLIEVEELNDEGRTEFAYRADAADAKAKAKADHAILLHQAGFIEGHLVEHLVGPRHFLSPKLTWAGHDLLETIRSKAVWERIKTAAKDKGH